MAEHTGLASALYHGWVRHRRRGPHPHAFRYRLFMLYLDLDEVDTVVALNRCWSNGRRNLAEIRRSDYLGDPDVPLKQAVLDAIEPDLGFRPDGPVRMLTHGRYFGHCFNPVSFYYAWHRGEPAAIVAEITNTPWRERHRYVLAVDGAEREGANWCFAFAKDFHVSPFLDMDMDYRWRFSPPGKRLLVHMDNLDGRRERPFDATLVMRREPVTGKSLGAVLRRYPAMTLKVVAGIHWEALRLWLKRNPVYDHPSKREPAGS